MKKNFKVEPYQPFFLSGLLISVLGLGVWILFQQGMIPFYPMEAHAFLMVMCFLFAYINGFLMTAVPKMAQADPATPLEITVGLVMLWIQVPCALLGMISLNHSWAVIQILFLVFFILRRFLSRKANPPKAFIFLPFGLAAAFIGSLLLAWRPEGLPPSVLLLAKNLLYQAFTLNLILGLGSRLVPALSRVQGALDVRALKPEKFRDYLVPALLLNSAFGIEAFINPSAGQILKFAMIAWMAVFHLKIFSPLQVRGYLAIGLRTSVVMLGLGFLAAAFFPGNGIHLLHLSYIGGFALLTFLISTRVVLAHGGYSLQAELDHVQLVWFFALAVMIAFSRLAGGFAGAHAPEIILMVFIAWVSLCGLWLWSFGRKLLKISV